MKIGIIGAGGKSGQALTREALGRGHAVTAIVRDPGRISEKGAAVLQRDLFALSAEDVRDFDAVIDAFRAADGKEEQHRTSMEHLIGVFEGLPLVRLLVVGGAGSLYVDDSRKVRLMDSPGFPPAYLPTASNMARAFDRLRESKVNWTYLSPAAEYDPGGRRSGAYTLGDEVMIVNRAGESYVSYADYALAMIDEVERAAYPRRRFTVVSDK